jgi:phage terminase small subunit
LAKPLSARERKFVDAYLGAAGGNATKAAIAAGITAGSARFQGSRFLARPHVHAAIQARQAKAAEKADVTAERVVQELARIAFFDIREVFDERGHLKPVSQFSDDAAAAIGAIELQREHTRTVLGADSKANAIVVSDVMTERVLKIRANDKNSALVSLCRRFGLFQDRVKLSFDIEDLFRHDEAPA